jgi:hypothetical protein
LGKGLHGDGFEVGVAMVEGLDTGVLDEVPGICDDPAGCAADVMVNFEYLFDAFRHNEGGVESSFDSKDNPFLDLDTDSG